MPGLDDLLADGLAAGVEILMRHPPHEAAQRLLDLLGATWRVDPSAPVCVSGQCGQPECHMSEKNYPRVVGSVASAPWPTSRKKRREEQRELVTKQAWRPACLCGAAADSVLPHDEAKQWLEDHWITCPGAAA